MPLTRLTAEQRVWSYTVAKCLTYKQLPVLHKGNSNQLRLENFLVLSPTLKSCIIAYFMSLPQRGIDMTLT